MTENTGALAGLKVIDLSRVLGGPYATQILGDHGAELIKVEPPTGDEVRTWGPPFKDGAASYFIGVNRNKRGMSLDFRKEEAKEILFKLLEDADVLIENLKAGTLEKWGLGYEDELKTRFPKLIYCRLTGFGVDGPLGGLPGYDAAIQAFAGLMSINGDPQSGPTKLGTPIVDIGAGMMCLNGILMALYERQKSGLGQCIDVSLFDAGIAMLHPQAPNWFLSGKDPVPMGNGHPNITPYDRFDTANGQIFLAVGNNKQFKIFCDELGLDGVAEDVRFVNMADRNTNRPALNEIVSEALSKVDGKTFAEHLLKIGVPAGPVLSIPELMNHPHTIHNQMRVEKDGYEGTGIPIKFSRTPGSVRTAPPVFNGETKTILREHGYSDDEIAKLEATGAFPST